MSLEKYKGIIPAFYACYDANGKVSPERIQDFTRYLIDKGVHGLYPCGSSGECIYQTLEERKTTLENVMKVARGKVTVIAHVACNDIEQSKELARHAQSVGVDAIACIPPIYFKLSDNQIAVYWNEISKAAAETDFMIYNIPQLAGVSLNVPLLMEMKKNPKFIGVKNSSMPTVDILNWKKVCANNGVVLNGPDEQLVAGLAMGADGGIGGTYGVMPELYLKIYELMNKNEVQKAREVQFTVCSIIDMLCSCKGNMYGIIKEVLKLNGVDIGTARLPLAQVEKEDTSKIDACFNEINNAIKKYSEY